MSARDEAERRYPSLRADDEGGQRRDAFEAGAAWQAEQGVKPGREALARAIAGYVPDDLTTASVDDWTRWQNALATSDHILTAWPGRTEHEIREEIAQEIEDVSVDMTFMSRDRSAGFWDGIHEAARLARGGQA